MEKTFYAIVTQYDCDPTRTDMPAQGPLLLECYLNDEHTSEERVGEIAKRFAHYGWVRIAKVTVEIPGE